MQSHESKINSSYKRSKAKKREIDGEVIQSNSGICVECGEQVVSVKHLGQKNCSKCGLITSENEIDLGSEVRAYSSDEENKRKRTGPPLPIDFDITQSVFIDLKPNTSQDLRRAAKYNTLRTQVQINFNTAMFHIRRICSDLDLSRNIREQAIYMFKKVNGEGLLKGRSIIAASIACLYFACRHFKRYKTLEELSGSQIPPKTKATVKLLRRKFMIKTTGAHPGSFVASFISDLKINPKWEASMLDLIDRIMNQRNYSGKMPRGIAAGAIYTICLENNIKITQVELARVAKITDVTLRSRHKEFVKLL